MLPDEEHRCERFFLADEVPEEVGAVSGKAGGRPLPGDDGVGPIGEERGGLGLVQQAGDLAVIGLGHPSGRR